MNDNDHSFTPEQVIDLLSVAASYDQRTVGTGDVTAWTWAANHGRWDPTLALTAVVDHYTNIGGRIEPSDITKWIRKYRQDQALRYQAPQPTIPSGRRTSAELEEVHAEANAWPCRFCGAPAGQRCAHPVTKVATKIPHMMRLKDVRRDQLVIAAA